MKKFLYILIVLQMSQFCSNSQSTRFGISAGTAIANYKFKYAGTSISGDSKVGFTVGILVDIPASTSFKIQPALNLIQKGSTSEDVGEKLTTNINCIEIPVNLLYKSLGKSRSFFAGAGPSFAFNISGKQKYDDGTTTEEEDIKFGMIKTMTT